MLQNNYFTIFLWLLIIAFISFLFIKEDKSKEEEAVLRSTQLSRGYISELFNNAENEMEQAVLDYGNDPRDRKILDRHKEGKYFMDSLENLEKLEWAVLLGQLIQSPNDSIYPNYLIDSLLYTYPKSESKALFSIHQNILNYYYYAALDNYRNRLGGFHRSYFGQYLQIYTLDSVVLLYSHSATYTHFIIEPHFDKPKYYSTNFIFDKNSVIRFQTITKTFIDGEKIERSKRYEITPTNGQILSPVSYKEIKK